MRATVELPEELLRRAQDAAATQGISLDEIVARALEHEVPPCTKKARLDPPSIGDPNDPKILNISPEEMEEAAIPIAHHIEILTRRR